MIPSWSSKWPRSALDLPLIMALPAAFGSGPLAHLEHVADPADPVEKPRSGSCSSVALREKSKNLAPGKRKAHKKTERGLHLFKNLTSVEPRQTHLHKKWVNYGRAEGKAQCWWVRSPPVAVPTLAMMNPQEGP